MLTEMVLRGFSARLGDLRGRMRFCHPILSPRHNGKELFVATDIQWKLDGTGLQPVSEDEVQSFGTLWSEGRSIMHPGIGVALIGSEFMAEVSLALGSAEVNVLPFNWDDELGCWIYVGPKVSMDQCAERLRTLSRQVFDLEFRRSASGFSKLSSTGSAALFVLRRTPGRRDTDVAMRELAAANVQNDHDLYRRLLAVLSVRLGVTESDLDEKVRRYVGSIRSALFLAELRTKNSRLVGQIKTMAVEPDVGGNELNEGVKRHVGSIQASSIFAGPRTKDSRLVGRIKTKTSVSEPALESSLDSLDDQMQAFPRVREIYHTIVHRRPLELGHTSTTLIGRGSSDMREHVYGRRWQTNQLAELAEKGAPVG